MGESLLSIQLPLAMSIICICLSILTTSTVCNTYSTNITNGLVLDLIPRNIINPPTYPPNSTLHERIDLALSRVLTLKTSYSEKVASPLYPDGTVYYVRFNIGSKNVPVIASLDTGSHFLWIECAEHNQVRNKRKPIYAPKNSASYKRSACLSPGDSYCKKVRGGGCDGQNRCKYAVHFGDTSYSKGFIGFENLAFMSPDLQYHQITNVLFGCGTDTHNINPHEDGVFGIGSKELSILKQTGNKLSYCFGDINDATMYSSHLALGDQAKFLGNPVKLELKKDAYVVKLKRIVFGQNDRISMSSVSVMVDTGTTLTHFSDDIYQKIRSKVDTLIGTKMPKIRTRALRDGLCYAAEQLITDFPIVTLSFYERSALVIDIKGMFLKIPDENAYCLAFKSSTKNIIGAINMQHHNIGFNLNTKQAYFRKTPDCNPIHLE